METALTQPALISIQPFRSWYEKRHDYAKEWKERNKSDVVGTFCTYVPEEILYAHDMLPVRILGSHEPQDVTEPHIFGMFCPFSRDALAQGLKGKYSYVDAVVLSQSCLHMRQAYTNWKHYLPVKWSYYLPMPNEVQSPDAKTMMESELARFMKFLFQETSRQVSSGKLEEGIALMDANRRLLRQIYELRKLDRPLVTGTDCLFMAVTSQFIHKSDHTKALEAVLAEAEGKTASRETGIRLMTVGSENDDVRFFEMVESLGATVVIDEQCAGSRYFWNFSVQRGDPLSTIAHRYVDRPPCPTKDYPARQRFGHILRLAKEYGVQGAIIMQEKFCDPHEADNPALTAFLKENGIPVLLIEFDSTNPLGPIRIRVEAFLETLKEEELF